MGHDSEECATLPADGQVLRLPRGWEPVKQSMLTTALAQTARAFAGSDTGVTHAVGHLLEYYDPAGKFSGATFLEVKTYDDYSITAADLWAVSTLSMTVPPDAGRALMAAGPLSTIIRGELQHLPVTLPLSEATPAHLDHMLCLYEAIRTMLPPLGKNPETNQWVLSSKICARKRPLLFPVRDSKVCIYLAKNKRMGGKSDQLGWFSRDIQVFAHLITDPLVCAQLSEVREQLNKAQRTWSFDWCDLRLLDAVLWMQAIRTNDQ